MTRECQHKSCNKKAIYRVQVGSLDDRDACEKHAKGLPIHWEWTPQREQQFLFYKQKLEEYRRSQK